jgi:16S rRNA (adenine1518-N6/adenine1519-N6)-dimethyltransferase
VSFLSPRTILRRLGLRPRKSLGQHFLVHPHQAQRIAEALGPGAGETVLEIGAGLGALTVFLAAAAGKVVALEMDPALARFLQEELFPETPRVEVVCRDVLAFDFLDLSREVGGPLAVAGNLPYQITSPLLFKLIRELPALSRAVLMMQQEVGDRLLARPGTKDYGILSVLTQYHFSLERRFTLSPANFYPRPQVSSVVLGLRPASAPPRARDEALLARVVKAAFGQRRKNLNNTLVTEAPALGLPPEAMRSVLQELGIDPRRRGETLAGPEFVAICNKMAPKAGGTAAN